MKRILMVDDNPSLTEEIGSYLEHYFDQEVITALNGLEGLHMLLRDTFIDIVVSDYNMLVMDGYLFSKEIRTNPSYAIFKNIPIIGLGAFPEDKREYLTVFRQKTLILS